MLSVATRPGERRLSPDERRAERVLSPEVPKRRLEVPDVGGRRSLDEGVWKRLARSLPVSRVKGMEAAEGARVTLGFSRATGTVRAVAALSGLRVKGAVAGEGARVTLGFSRTTGGVRAGSDSLRDGWNRLAPLFRALSVVVTRGADSVTPGRLKLGAVAGGVAREAGGGAGGAATPRAGVSCFVKGPETLLSRPEPFTLDGGYVVERAVDDPPKIRLEVGRSAEGV